jgi:glutamine synthetase adenylyltransferase
MLWLLGRLSGPPDSDSRRKLVGIAAECAELVLPIYEKKYPGDTRVRDCIEECKAYAAGDPSVSFDRLRELRMNAAVADAYSDDDAAVADAYSDDDAADAATDAAAAADYAADAAATDDARKSMQKQCADIVRKHYPQPPEF